MNREKEIEEFVQKIHPIYVLMDWRWVGGIPTKEDLYKQIVKFTDKLHAEEKIDRTSSGGIYAEREEGGITYGMDIHGGYAYTDDGE